MSKKIIPAINFENYKKISDNEVEDSGVIDQNQLKYAKIFSTREEYLKTLSGKINYLEIGVAWGYYSKLVAELNITKCIHLLDTYNQYHLCWGLRYNNFCSCNQEHDNYTPETHQEYIENLFSKYENVKTFKGDSRDILKNLPYKYDYIYIDSNNDRDCVTPTLFQAAKMINDNGIIGLNDYVLWDGVIEERGYGVVQAVNEFLSKNPDWSVDALALHPLGFYDIYIKKGIMNVQGGD